MQKAKDWQSFSKPKTPKTQFSHNPPKKHSWLIILGFMVYAKIDIFEFLWYNELAASSINLSRHQKVRDGLSPSYGSKRACVFLRRLGFLLVRLSEPGCPPSPWTLWRMQHLCLEPFVFETNKPQNSRVKILLNEFHWKFEFNYNPTNLRPRPLISR